MDLSKYVSTARYLMNSGIISDQQPENSPLESWANSILSAVNPFWRRYVVCEATGQRASSENDTQFINRSGSIPPAIARSVLASIVVYGIIKSRSLSPILTYPVCAITGGMLKIAAMLKDPSLLNRYKQMVEPASENFQYFANVDSQKDCKLLALPTDWIFEILQYLSPKDIFQIKKACKRFYNLLEQKKEFKQIPGSISGLSIEQIRQILTQEPLKIENSKLPKKQKIVWINSSKRPRMTNLKASESGVHWFIDPQGKPRVVLCVEEQQHIETSQNWKETKAKIEEYFASQHSKNNLASNIS